MLRRRLLSLGLAISLPLSAQTPAPATPAEPVDGGELPPLLITGSREPRPGEDRPYSVGVIERETLERAGPGLSLAESLNRLPGLIANDRRNYAQDLQLSIRGFGARASFGTRGLRLYSDGIPASSPDGQGQVTHFDLASSERIEVLRGPWSALYGNASGGVLALIGRPVEARGARLALDGGGGGLRQWRLGAETPFGEQAGGRFLLSHSEVDGDRPHSAAQRDLAEVRLEGARGDQRLRLTLTRLDQPAQDPLGLTREQFEADPRQTAAVATQFNTRKQAEQEQLGLNWTSRLGGAWLAEAGVTAWAGTREVTQWQSIPVATQQASARHPGGVIDFDRRFHGVDARLGLGPERLRLVLGLNLEVQDEDRRGFENFRQEADGSTTLGVTGALRREEVNQSRFLDPYAQLEWQASPTQQLSLGLRGGSLRFDSDDRFLGNGDDSGARRFHYLHPALGWRWQFDPSRQLFASLGSASEAPTFNEIAYRADGSSGFNAALQAQDSRQAELGLRQRWAGGRLELALFRADAEDELVVAANSGGRQSFANAGRSRRQGVELGLVQRAGPLRLQAALTGLDARYRDAFLTCGPPPCSAPSVTVASGNRLPALPRWNAYTELSLDPAPGWAGVAAALELSARDAVLANDLNSARAPGYALLALRLERRLPLGGGDLALRLRVDNLLDRDYAGSVIVNEANQRFFEPGSPRSLLLGLDWRPRF
ncbi:MAG TPA: TonB-dependent receptor [Nevskiaceae bacterium]|nr:TonB-dependent receptor [Nevskiaceae bacterium]